MQIETRPPLNLDTSLKGIYINQRNYTPHPPIEIFRLKNVFMTRSGIILEKNTLHPASLLKDHTKQDLWHLKKYVWGNYFLRPKTSLKSTTFAVVHNHWSSSYYHWIIEALSRLIALQDYTQEDFTLLLPESYQGFQTESLKAFTIKNLHFIPQKENLTIENLLLPEIPFSFLFRKNILQELRKVLLTYAQKQAPIPTENKRIYVSRATANLRKVQNENQVIALLQQYGFEVILAEKLNFWQQVSLFQQTQYLIAPHGAALVNMLFMPEKSRVMELAPPTIRTKTPPYRYFFPMYWYMANALDLDFLWQFCTYTDVNTQTLLVDIAALEKNLALMLAS